MNDPRIPALLVSHRRPGFYFRVLEEGEVAGGRRDRQGRLRSGADDGRRGRRAALPPGHPRQQLLRALRIPALSPGWQASFRALLDGEPGAGNAGLAVGEPAAGVARLPPADGHRHRARERLGGLHPPRGPRRRSRCRRRAPASTSRCASGPDASSGRCCATTRCRGRPAPATTGSASSASTTASPAAICTPASRRRPSSTSPRRAARSSSTARDAPVLLISAGIGATPVLAMLHALAQEHSDREIWWLHGARSGRDHAFAAEARDAARRAPERPHATSATAARRRRRRGPRLRQRGPALRRRCSPSSSCRATPRPTSAGRRRSWTRSAPAWPRSASTPPASTPSRSGRAPGLTPGIAAAPARTPHPPAGEPGSGPTIEFARSDLAVPWSGDYAQPARARRGLRRARPLVVPHRRLPHLRDDAHRRRRSTTARTRSSRPPTAARSSAARSPATTWCSTCELRQTATPSCLLGAVLLWRWAATPWRRE